MKRYFILAAIAAFPTVATAASVPARAYNLSTDELAICQVLELAHESSCAEYELILARQLVATAETEASKNG